MVKTGVADVVSHYTFEMLAPWGIVGILLLNIAGRMNFYRNVMICANCWDH